MWKRRNRLTHEPGEDVILSEEIAISEDAGDERPIISPLDGSVEAARARNSQWRWGLRFGALAAVIALVIIVAVALAPLTPLAPRFSSQRASPRYTALALSPELRFCATNGYWSPDGRRIAVPRAPDCGSGGAGVMNLPDISIYDATSGKQLTEYTIMPAIEDALARANLSGAQITYTDVSWSPDQRTLAAQFEATQTLPQAASGTPIRSRAGVALIALTGSHTGAVSALISASALSLAAEGTGFSPGPLAVDEWDTRQGRALRLDLPPSLGYEWLPGDLLIAADPPSGGGTSATPPFMGTASPVSNPMNQQRISLWRTAYLVEVSAHDCGQSAPANTPRARLTALYLSATAWSPDGRYLLTITQVARAPQAPILRTDTPLPPFCLPASAARAFPQAPIHDRAMRAALSLLGGVANVGLLWSPDGAQLAALPSANSQLSNTITLYDARSGAVRARISAGPSLIPGAQGSDANALFISGAWSPDGRRLLAVVQGQQFNIRIYDTSALG